jgi:hypothetical protein
VVLGPYSPRQGQKDQAEVTGRGPLGPHDQTWGFSNQYWGIPRVVGPPQQCMLFS